MSRSEVAEESGILNGPKGSRFQQTLRSRRANPLKVHSPFPSQRPGLQVGQTQISCRLIEL